MAATQQEPAQENPPPLKDTGLRQLLTWTVIALVVALLMTYFAVTLVVRWFDSP